MTALKQKIWVPFRWKYYILLGSVCCFGQLFGKAQEMPPLFYQSWSPIEVDLSLAIDNFRGIYSGSWSGAFGAFAAVNLAVQLPRSFALALAGSYGLYEWNGRASTPFKNSKTLQQQGFITGALYQQTPDDSGWNAGFAYDWMLNKNFGLFAVNPFIDQVRGQFGYQFRKRNEFGLWGTYAIHKSFEESQSIPLEFRGISQVNLFWSYYFENNGYAMVWAGSPYRDGLLYTGGRAGRFIAGTQFSIPMMDSLTIEGHASYMAPRSWSGTVPAKNYGADICFGVTYSFGKRRIAKSSYMSLANNSNFMVDTNQNF